jgi:hypothetical protein
MNSGTRALVAALLFAGAACASAAEWGVQQLMGGLAQVKSAKARYTERKTVALLSAPLDSEGTLVYTAPGRLEKRTTAPRPESLLLDGDRLTLESQGKRRTFALQAYPVIWAFVESIRSTLAGDLATLSRFYQVGFEGGEGRWRLTLNPLEAAMKDVVSEIRIEGAGSRLSGIDIIETQGDRSVMTITPE